MQNQYCQKASARFGIIARDGCVSTKFNACHAAQHRRGVFVDSRQLQTDIFEPDMWYATPGIAARPTATAQLRRTTERAVSQELLRARAFNKACVTRKRLPFAFQKRLCSVRLMAGWCYLTATSPPPPPLTSPSPSPLSTPSRQWQQLLLAACLRNAVAFGSPPSSTFFYQFSRVLIHFCSFKPGA